MEYVELERNREIPLKGVPTIRTAPSRAALAMVVGPDAPTAHSMAFSVAPTLGRAKCTSPPSA